jgi:hypothetical protein
VIPRSHFTRIADEQEVDARTVEREIRSEEVWLAFERNARHKGIDPAQFSERFDKRVRDWRTRWDSEMAEHLAGEPDQFETVERAVRRALRPRLATG